MVACNFSNVGELSTVLDGLTNLKHLTVIRTISGWDTLKQLFKNENTVNTLDLSHNRIKNLETDAFRNLKNLKTLKLNNNRITTLTEDYFSENLNLESIILKNNQLKMVSAKIFIDLTKIIKIDLTGNCIVDKSFDRLTIGILDSFTDFGGSRSDDQPDKTPSDDEKPQSMYNHFVFRMFLGKWTF